jgi:hypothetical protein
MTEDEAAAIVRRIEEETGLRGIVFRDEDGGCRVEVEVPPVGGAIRSVVTVWDPDDWEWIAERHVWPRLRME